MAEQVQKPPAEAASESRSHTRLGLYRFMSRFSFLNYRAKIMVMAFLGTHIPLIALAIWLAIQGSKNWSEALPTLGVALVATLVGTAITLFVLDRLLRPVLLTSAALCAYRKSRERIAMPLHFQDEVGTLMADADNALSHLDECLRGLEDAIAAKNRFLATAAHDLRQPSQALLMYAEHLIEFPEMQAELAPKIASASASVKQMFDSLFDVANLEAGNAQLKFSEVDVAELFRSVCTQFEPLALEKNIELRIRCGKVSINTDRFRLQRMISNVVSNAIKYSPAGCAILLAARVDKSGSVRIDVWDQGDGIPTQDLMRVFDAFYRVDRPGNNHIDGVGLGLSIVAKLADLLGARVQLTSKVSCGTRFRFRLASSPVV